METTSMSKPSMITIRSSSAPIGLWPLLIDALYWGESMPLIDKYSRFPLNSLLRKRFQSFAQAESTRPSTRFHQLPYRVEKNFVFWCDQPVFQFYPRYMSKVL
jgi:hypothetical protein